MGWYVHLTVSFRCNDADRLKTLALDHFHQARQAEGTKAQLPIEAANFLQALGVGEGVGHGPKGSVCAWGCVGNYTTLEQFVDALKPFWLSLWDEAVDKTGELEAVLDEDDSVIVFHENEQSSDPTAAQIRRHKSARVLEVKFFGEFGFSWSLG